MSQPNEMCVNCGQKIGYQEATPHIPDGYWYSRATGRWCPPKGMGMHKPEAEVTPRPAPRHPECLTCGQPTTEQNRVIVGTFHFCSATCRDIEYESPIGGKRFKRVPAESPAREPQTAEWIRNWLASKKISVHDVYLPDLCEAFVTSLRAQLAQAQQERDKARKEAQLLRQAYEAE